MVLGSTLLAVRSALSPDPRPAGDIADELGLQDDTVRQCLILLIKLGLAEKEVFSPPKRSNRRRGWVMAGYKAAVSTAEGVATKT